MDDNTIYMENEIIIGTTEDATSSVSVPVPIKGSHKISESHRLELAEKLKDGELSAYHAENQNVGSSVEDQRANIWYRFGRIMDENGILPFVVCRFCTTIYAHTYGAPTVIINRHRCLETIKLLSSITVDQIELESSNYSKKRKVNNNNNLADQNESYKEELMLQKVSVETQYYKALQLKTEAEIKLLQLEQIKLNLSNTVDDMRPANF